MRGDNPIIHYHPGQEFAIFDICEGYETAELLEFLGIPPSSRDQDRDGGYDTLPFLYEIRSIEIEGTAHFLLIHWPPTKTRPTDAEIQKCWDEEFN